MKTIFVMMKCELGKAYKVAEEAVETVEQVSEVYSVSGQYDLLMKCYVCRRHGHRPFRRREAADAARRQGHLHHHGLQGLLRRQVVLT